MNHVGVPANFIQRLQRMIVRNTMRPLPSPTALFRRIHAAQSAPIVATSIRGQSRE